MRRLIGPILRPFAGSQALIESSGGHIKRLTPPKNTTIPPRPQQTFLDEKEVIDRVLSVVKNFEKARVASVWHDDMHGFIGVHTIQLRL